MTLQLSELVLRVEFMKVFTKLGLQADGAGKVMFIKDLSADWQLLNSDGAFQLSLSPYFYPLTACISEVLT